MKPVIILDLDNCIADDAWRIARINWGAQHPMERYHVYHLLSIFDDLANADVLRAARADEEQVVIFTARPVRYRTLTERWLYMKGVPCKHLIMRNDNDHRPSVELKRSMVEWLTALYDIPIERVRAAFDDRTDVVEMFRSMGLDGRQLSVHDECAYTDPKLRVAS